MKVQKVHKVNLIVILQHRLVQWNGSCCLFMLHKKKTSKKLWWVWIPQNGIKNTQYPFMPRTFWSHYPCAHWCPSAANLITALSDSWPLCQVRGGCWCLRDRWVLCCIISIGWILWGPPPPSPSFFFFLRMHHLLTWQCVAVPSTTVSHLGQHPPSAFTAVHRQSNQSEPVLSWPEEGCDFSARCCLAF